MTLGTLDWEALGAVPALVEAVEHGRGSLRLEAMQSLCRILPNWADQCVAFVATLLKDPDPEVRAEAAQALGWAGPPAKTTIGPLIEMVNDTEQSRSCRRAAIAALVSIDPDSREVVDALIGACKDPDISGVAAMHLSHYRRDARRGVPVLAEVLEQDEPPGWREDIAAALGRIGGDAKQAVPALIHVAKTDNRVLTPPACIEALGSIGAESPQAVSFLVEVLADGQDPVLRREAAEALGRLGPKARDAVPHLVKALASAEDPGLRRAAAAALGDMAVAAKDKDAVAALSRALSDEDDEVRIESAAALAKMGFVTDELLDTLVRQLQPERPVHAPTRWAIQTLGEIGPKANSATPRLIEILKGDDSLLAVDAARALGRIGTPRSDDVPPLLAALNHQDRLVACTAAEALCTIQPKHQVATRRLIEMLGSDDYSDRVSAAIFLARVGPVEEPVIAALSRALSGRHPSVRSAAATALGRLGTAATGAIPSLTKALDDRYRSVRESAATALREIQKPD